MSFSSAPLSRRLLLVGWDAADWQMIHPLMDAGRMPTLRRLVEGGVMGSLAALRPMLSPILWTSIATGRRAFAHGVSGFVEPRPDRAGVRPVGTRARRVKALWNILAQAGRRCVVGGWLASHPAEPLPGGAMFSDFFARAPAGSKPLDWPPAEGSVQPPERAAGLNELRVHPREIDGAFLQGFIPRGAELDQSDPAVQRRLTFLAERLAEVVSIHAAATELLESSEWDFGAVYYECIDQAGHEFMPFHPPRGEGIGARDFELYREVMAGVYQFHDLMLARLVELAGPDAHVMLVSDHGFESGARRPRGAVEPAQWHRPHGIFALHGPGVRADASAEGATLLDIAPTILAMLGLPVGGDMEGKVLVTAFEKPPDIARIPSWEEVPGTDGRLPAAADEEDPAAAQAALRQLVELGYVAAPGADVEATVARAEAEAAFNLAVSLLEGSRAGEAKAVLADLTAHRPDEPRYWRALAQAAFSARAPEDAAPAAAALERLEPGQPPTLLLRGLLAWARDDLAACGAAFEEAARIAPSDPAVQTALGRLWLRRREWARAEQAFRAALAVEPDAAEAHYGMSVARPRQNFVEEGVQHGLRAVELRHHFPEAHFQLGAVLSRMSWFDRAAVPFEVTLRHRPGFVLAHRYLARI